MSISFHTALQSPRQRVAAGNNANNRNPFSLARRNCVNVAALSSISTVPALASPALKPQHFVPAAPAGPPSAPADPGPGSKALSSHVTFVTFSDPDL